jgi:hypothetical protein
MRYGRHSCDDADLVHFDPYTLWRESDGTYEYCVGSQGVLGLVVVKVTDFL